ncbi:MAG: dihydromonapterin reductase/dihydrofolate reductase [Lentisphaeria bacterium]|jgi:dihydromonapterin reductase/dihydrofolate reductase
MNKATVLITGASRRLGLYLCERFIADGFFVIAVTRSSSAELNALYNSRLKVYQVDSYHPQNVQPLIKKIASEVNHIDVLIHNASMFETDQNCGVSRADSPASVDLFQEMFNVHMALPAWLNTAFKGKLENNATAGNIIHITDIYAENPSSDYALYCSTKAGLENLSKGFAKKFAPRIRVNTIQPGPIQFLPEHTNATKDAVLSQTLLDIEGGFLPIYQAVVSIIDNHYMTGSSIKVDGGRSLGRG